MKGCSLLAAGRVTGRLWIDVGPLAKCETGWMIAGTSSSIGGMTIGIGFTPSEDEESARALRLRTALPSCL